MGTTQFINQKLSEETPIFIRRRIDHHITSPLTHVVVANNNIVLAMANKVLVRIDMDKARAGVSGGKPEEIDLKKSLNIGGAKISSLFLDPTGSHLLIAMKSDGSPELYYLNKKWSKPRICSKFNSILVTAVGWNYQNKDSTSTGPILVGTALGLLIETELSVEESLFVGIEKHKKEMFDIGEGKHTPVTGLQMHQLPTTDRFISKYFVIVTTQTRMYQFLGYVDGPDVRPLFGGVFNSHLNGQKAKKFVESGIGSGSGLMKHSTLSFYFEPLRNRNHSGTKLNKLFPDQFGFMTEMGMRWGKIDKSPEIEEEVTIDCKFIETGDTTDIPKSAFITKFHTLMLYKDRLKAICLLNQQKMFDDPHDEPLVGMAHDQVMNIYWVFSEYAVYKYQVDNEARHIWKIYLEQEEFELAKHYCAEQPEAVDMILTKEAHHLYKEGRWVESAARFAQTESSFEEVTLKFMDLEDKTPLKIYLRKKLDILKPSEKTQITLIVIWLIELYQNQLGALRELENNEFTQAEVRRLEEEFQSLLSLRNVEDSIKNNKEVVYSLLGSYGDMQSGLHLAIALNDTERVIQFMLTKRQHSIILTLPAFQSDPDLVYKYCAQLLHAEPERTVDMLVNLGRSVSPVKLLPSFLVSQSEADVAVHCIRYLEHAVKNLNCKEESVHNLLVSLYVKHQTNKVQDYLPKSKNSFCCDPKYALKQCIEAGLVREAVHLYSVLGQHERALEMALTVDVNLAAQCAESAGKQADGHEDLSRKLWLMVARHVVQEKNDIKQAMEFLKKCDTVKIEDILPFFPDFVTIDHFKDAICESLQQYTDHIESLKEEMNEAKSSSEVIRKEIIEAKAEHQFVRATDRCALCCDLLMTRPFYIFSCTHMFHSDCLAEAIYPHLPQAKQKRLLELQSRLASSTNENDLMSQNSRSITMDKYDQVQAELDDLIASECLFCGDIMVRNIDKLFIEDSEFNKVMKEWM